MSNGNGFLDDVVNVIDTITKGVKAIAGGKSFEDVGDEMFTPKDEAPAETGEGVVAEAKTPAGGTPLKLVKG